MDAKSSPEGDGAADSAPKGLIVTALVLGKSLIHPIIIRLVCRPLPWHVRWIYPLVMPCEYLIYW